MEEQVYEFQSTQRTLTARMCDVYSRSVQFAWCNGNGGGWQKEQDVATAAGNLQLVVTATLNDVPEHAVIPGTVILWV